MFDGVTFWEFLRPIEAVSRESNRQVIEITDNAKYHHAKLHAPGREEHHSQFRLDFLPPYSPELNPIERVWKRTRRNCLHNAYFPTLAMVTEKVEEQFPKWSDVNPELQNLCHL